jgi:UDP-glucuronate 4-epimerase
MGKAKVLITGIAGFIGYHLAFRLAQSENYLIYGIDNLNDYYDVNLKYSRLKNLGVDSELIKDGLEIKSNSFNNIKFKKISISDDAEIELLFLLNKFDYVINLAAQAGVRYSLSNPSAYLESNLRGFINILEACRYSNIKHLLYASTSSVYGLNSNLPLTEDNLTDHPVSLYAASKKSNELMAHSYSHLFKIPTTGLRFFTVYGPFGRPDMALFLFADAIVNNKPIQVFNHGKMRRDFTFVDDIVESIFRLLERPPENNMNWDTKLEKSSQSSAPYRILNIGNSTPVELTKYIEILESELGKVAKKVMLDLQSGDVLHTHADTSNLYNLIGFVPKTPIEVGIREFIKWFKNYYKLL